MSHNKHLWAPWKMEYIKNKDSSQKLFSEKANESEDRENLILYRGEFCYIIMNYYPYNIGEGSGASIPKHLHFHVVPRWKSDTSFMPVVGSTKVVAQGLYDTYDQLKPFFEGIS